MSQQEVDQVAQEGAPEIELEGGTYEIIRNRLVSHAKELRGRLDKLNVGRKEVFGSIDTTLLSTERITTDHNCVSRDMVAIGNRFVFGYNVHFGLKTETDLSDVFSVYEFSDNTFHQQPLDLLGDERFQRDFREVYRYYKNAVFSKFFVAGPHIYMTFQVGKAATDIKAFKWMVDGESLVYIDNRSDHEVRFPPQHELDWIRTHRDLHQGGQHPHVSIEDRVFVETVGGDLTIKIENNTDTGKGIYSEDVSDADQTLDDAEIYYAVVGNIIVLKIRPYQEENFRYIVYNEKVQQARRVDSIANACVLLPDDHGLIFSNGYYLQNGEHKTFDSELRDMLFERRITSTNGEDYLYIFYNTESGVYVLLRYNLIEQQVDTPIICHGATLFHGGQLVCFKSQDDPQKHHAVQLWQTPYVGEDFMPETNTDSFLYKVGNRDIVRGMAECHEILNLIDKEDAYANLYVDMVKLTTDVLDSYFWLDRDETFHLNESVADIREAATAAVEEYDKVVRVKQSTRDQTRKVEAETRDAINSIHRRRFDKIDDFVQVLGDLRRIRGELISLRELRYVDLELVESLEGETVEQSEKVAQRCVEFLLRPDSLSSYQNRAKEQTGRIEGLTKVSDAKTLEEEIGQGADELEMLIEVVSNLKIDDATHRTQIIDNISAIFSQLNAARAALKTKTKELMSVEGVAEFNSQMKLLNQGVVNYLDICDTPEKCEEFLTKVMIQLEELEGRFAEFDEFVLQLTEKREEVYNAFETRKLSLVEARNKRANTLMSAADRILKGIKSRVESFEEVNDINGYFASDLMIEKIRDIVEELGDLDDTVKVDDIQSRMKTIREDAVRQLKDRQDLYVDGENVIKLGTHQFSVNVQVLDLTTVLRDDEMQLHLSGTRFFEAIDDAELIDMKELWQQEVPSENVEIYRGEYLAYQIMSHLRHQPAELAELQAGEFEDLAAYVQRFMGPRYSEGYAKGVHDQDAAKILQQLMTMYRQVDLLRFHSKARALAALYWNHFVERKSKVLVEAKLKGFGDVSALFPDVSRQRDYIRELRDRIAGFVQETGVSDDRFVDEAGEYLFFELTQATTGFCISQTAFDLWEAFQTHLRANSFVERFDASVKAVHQDALTTFSLIGDWVNAFLQHRGDEHEAEYAEELTLLLMRKRVDVARVIGATVHADLSGLLGSHGVVNSGKYELHFNEFMTRLADSMVGLAIEQMTLAGPPAPMMARFNRLTW